MADSPVIAFTLGDPCGIGPEIILKLFKNYDFSRLAVPLVIGDSRVLRKRAKALGLPFPFTLLKGELSRGDIEKASTPALLDMENVPPDCPVGEVSEAGGRASGQYIEKGVELAMGRIADGLVTCPISKEALNKGGYPYPGHTEMLSDLSGVEDTAMMLSGEGLRVVLVTTHVALKELPRWIKKDRIHSILEITNRALTPVLGEPLRIGVAAFNPHGGEGGLFGDEEEREIIPAVKAAQEEGIRAKGPYSADSLFSERVRKDFDVIVVMYHDQGLIPIKMKYFGTAVNTTLGLPFVRTSVDHGTAFDIVGKGVADPQSLWEASLWAIKMLSGYAR